MVGGLVVVRTWRAGQVGLWLASGPEGFRQAVDQNVTLAALGDRLPAASFVMRDLEAGRAGGQPRSSGRLTEVDMAPRSSLDALVIVGDISHLGARDLADVGSETRPAGGTPRTPWDLGALGDEIPVAWSAITVDRDVPPVVLRSIARIIDGGACIAVTDEASRGLLLGSVKQEIDVVPPLSTLLPRIAAATTLRDRFEYLQHVDWYPRAPVILVQGDTAALPLIAELAPALRGLLNARPGWRLAALQLTGDDQEFASALRVALPELEHVGPPDATMEDVAAAVAGASLCIAADAYVVVTTAVYGRAPILLTSPGGRRGEEIVAELDIPAVSAANMHRLGELAERALLTSVDPRILDALATRVDEHFDRVGHHVARAWEKRPDDRDDQAEARVQRLERAYEVVVRQLHEERDHFQHQLRRQEAEVEQARREAEVARTEVAAAKAAPTDRRANRASRWLARLPGRSTRRRSP